MKTSRLDPQTIVASSLISGTCIGAGMLALPASAGQYGFAPTLLIMLCACVFMTAGGLYMADACLASQNRDAHLISLSEEYLGVQGKWLSWVVYLLIGVTSFVAYVSEGGKIFTDFLRFLGWQWDYSQGYLCYLLLYILVITTGSVWVSRINAALFALLLFFFLGLVTILLPVADTQLLFAHVQISWEAFSLMPLLLTVFSFPGIVPGITRIVNYERTKLRRAIILGTTVGFFLYTVWLMAVMAVVPSHGEQGLSAIYAMDRSVTQVLASMLGSSLFSTFAQTFGFLAITTSFIGVGWALNEFLMDGLHLRGSRNRLLLVTLTGLVTYSILDRYDRLFFMALETSGGLGDSLISGILPALMAFLASRRLRGDVATVADFFYSRYCVVSLFFFCVLLNEVYQLMYHA
ncbi:MAG: amino acid permease [Zetaproteobacteria bacterium]|nr:amino acid permease [Zetaproteobacteria bacterium]